MKQENINMFLCKNQGKFKNVDLIKIQHMLEQVDDKYFPLLMCTSYGKKTTALRILSALALIGGVIGFAFFLEYFQAGDLKVVVGTISVLCLVCLLVYTLANDREVNFIEFRGFIKSLSPNLVAPVDVKK